MKFSVSSMSRFLLAPLALATQPVAAEEIQYSEQDVYDATCIVIYAAALGDGPEAQDPVRVRGISSIVAYFVGKLRGRHSDMKIAEFITPQLAIKAVSADGQTRSKCVAEAQEMGNDLIATGAILAAAGEAMPK